MKHIARFVCDESGATAIDYGLIASLIGIAIIADVHTLDAKLSGAFTAVSDNLS